MKGFYIVGAGLVVIAGASALLGGTATPAGAAAACALILGIASTIFVGTLRLNGHRAQRNDPPSS